jgi:hypothetical protein
VVFVALLIVVALLLRYSEALAQIAGTVATEALAMEHGAAEMHVRLKSDSPEYALATDVLSAGLGMWLVERLVGRLATLRGRPGEDGAGGAARRPGA